MSARRVCRGTRPSRYHSVRAISMPFRRPDDMILMPCAPKRLAFCMARFMARRNMMRFSSCWVMLSAINLASTSGLRTSSMLTATGTPNLAARSFFSFSMSSPFLPMTTPGRAEKMVMRAFLAGRSMTTRATAAFFNLAFRYSRTLMSSASMPAKSRLLAYQRLDQLRLTARRKPVGWIFCPIVFLEPSVANRHVNVTGGFADAVATAFGAGRETLERGALLNVDGLHLQFVDVGTVVVFGVGDGGFQGLLDEARSFFLRERQDVERLVNLFAANQVGHQSTFVDRQANAANNCACLHGVSLLLGFFIAGVALERAGQRELAELVPDHLVGDVHRHVLLAVVHGNGQTDEVGQDHGAARPGLDRLLVLGGNGFLNLGQQVMVNKGTFFQRTSHLRYPLLLATRNNHVLRATVVTGTVTLGQVAPRIDRRHTGTGTAFTTTVRVIDRVHGHTADGGTDTHVTLDTGLAQLAQAVFGVGDFTDGGAAVHVDLANLAGAHTHLGIHAFTGQQHGGSTSGTGQLSTFARLQLDAVDGGTHGDVADRQGVAHADGRLGAAQQGGTDFNATGGDDVAALAV